MREKSFCNSIVLQSDFFPPLNCAPEEIGASTAIFSMLYFYALPQTHTLGIVSTSGLTDGVERGGREGEQFASK